MGLRSRVEQLARRAGRGECVRRVFSGFARIELEDGPAIEEGGPELILRVPPSAWRDPEAALSDEQRARIGDRVLVVPVGGDDEPREETAAG